MKDAADELKKRALAQRLRCARRSLLRPRRSASSARSFHKEVEKRIVLTLNKEMTDRPIPDIEELLVGEAAPPA